MEIPNLEREASQICEEREKQRAKQQLQNIELKQREEKELYAKYPK